MTDLASIADAVDALTNPIQVRERYERWVNGNRKTFVHQHTLPSLIDQLAAAIMPGEVYVEDTGGKIYRMPQSTPAARIEAIDASLTIDAGAALWCSRLRITLRETADRNLRALVGAQVDSDTAGDILADLRRWYGLAATLTGWERPAWRPDAPCPLCAQRGLRVRLDRRTAACAACGESWTPDTIGLLAEHVRQVGEAAAESRRWAGVAGLLDTAGA